jgi:GTP1/Obg family GTP-binding protein
MTQFNLFNKVEKASAIINNRFSTKKLSTTMESITKQLEFIKKDLENLQHGISKASKEDVQRIIIGVQAIREIESQSEELADLLCDIDYEYKKLHGISL